MMLEYLSCLQKSDAFICMLIVNGVHKCVVHLENHQQVHAYERSNRVYNYTLDPCGPIHIVVGDGGNREKMAIAHADEAGNCPEPSTTPDEYMGGFCAFNFTSGPAEGKFCWDRQPDYSAYRESSFGHGILEVFSFTLRQTRIYNNSRYKLLQLDFNTNDSPKAFLLILQWILEVNKTIKSLKINK